MSLETLGAAVLAQALRNLLDSTHQERTQFIEGIILIRHHDAFAYTLPDGRSGFVKLSQWPVCWSVKWYSPDDREQVVLADRIGEEQAKEVFSQLRKQLLAQE